MGYCQVAGSMNPVQLTPPQKSLHLRQSFVSSLSARWTEAERDGVRGTCRSSSRTEGSTGLFRSVSCVRTRCGGDFAHRCVPTACVAWRRRIEALREAGRHLRTLTPLIHHDQTLSHMRQSLVTISRGLETSISQTGLLDKAWNQEFWGLQLGPVGRVPARGASGVSWSRCIWIDAAVQWEQKRT